MNNNFCKLLCHVCCSLSLQAAVQLHCMGLEVSHRSQYSLLTTMSTEKPYKKIHTDRAARTYEWRFSDPSVTSTPLPMATNRDDDIVTVEKGTK